MVIAVYYPFYGEGNSLSCKRDSTRPGLEEGGKFPPSKSPAVYKIPSIEEMPNTRCRRKPYPWSTAALARSPFKTRKGVRTKGFTARSSLKSMGRWPRANGCYRLGDKYKHIIKS
jgi:hypothetical protein